VESTLPPSIQETLADHLAARPEVRFALLYGSAARGTRFRDLDIGVFVDRADVPAAAEFAYAFALADDLAALIPYPVDVRVINDAPLPFRYNVSRGFPLAINDRRALVTFLARTWDDFLDFRPIAMQYLKELR
jgi:predicted nucleotidyltransferase